MGCKKWLQLFCRPVIAFIGFSLIAVGLPPLATHGASAVAAAPPTATPADRDPTVPLDPSVTIQRGNQTTQTMSLRRTRTVDGREAVADRIIVGFRDGVSEGEKAAVHQAVAGRQGGVNQHALKPVGDGAQYVDVTGTPSLDAVIQAYRADPRVRYAEPDYIVHQTETPNDASFGNQYGMAKIQAPAAWDVTHGSSAVKIAILDCGIYEAHPDLAGKVALQQDFTGSPYGADDQCNHGTHVAGIASAATNNSAGVAGVGYNTALMNGKVLLEQYDSQGNLLGGSGSSTWVINGIHWATDNGAKVINLSLGGKGTCAQAYQDAINYAASKNVIVVAAAGNDGASELFQPADCAGVVSVASTDQNDARSSFSNYGTWVKVAAPGSMIYSTVNPTIAENNGNAYAYFQGTSMATPHVAGLVALIWATHWATDAQAVVNRLESTTDAVAGTGTAWQYGRINARAAIGGGPPVAVSISPTRALSGTSAFTLTVNGSGFQQGATVRWNGAPRATTVQSGTLLQAAILATDIQTAGSARVTVVNPDGQTAAQALSFTIEVAPAPPTRATAAPTIPGATAPPPAPAPPSRGPGDLTNPSSGAVPASAATPASMPTHR